jgi:type IV pilus assembly protein PilA
MSARGDRGFTLIELLIVVSVIGTITAIAVPGLLRARVSANEASAIGSMRAVISAQADYHAAVGGYADDLAKLAAVCPAVTRPFLATDLNVNGVVKSGYTFAIAPATLPAAAAGPADLCGAATATGYYSTAIPQVVGATGNRAFAANTLMAIWQNIAAAAPPTEAQMAAAPTPTILPLGR